jgi:dolichyl-phosphate-mannose-protein mannosyltransferase
VKNARRLLLILSAGLLAWAALVLATGGIQWRIAGVLFRSRDPGRALVLGLALLLLHALMFRESFVRDTDWAAATVRRWLPALALGCALVLAVQAVQYGSFTAGGSDSWGYLSQAYGWARGTLPRPEPFPFAVPWPSGDASLAPLAYRPGPQPHTMVPTYAPGLSLMMAAASVFGDCGPFLVVPLCAALAVWLTFLLGRRTAGPWVGILSAIFVVTSPIVVFQSMSPMSDVPAAALWTGAALAALAASRRSALATGLWTAAGLLVRPNLPIIPLVLLVHLAASSRGRERWIRVALFSAAVAPAAFAIAALNTAWYGAPWNSGYGAAAQLYSVSTILPNLARYPVWLWQSESPVVLLALLPLLPRFRGDAHQPAVRLFVALFVATLLSYLVYFRFEEWWYLRFLLPAIPALLVLVATGLMAIGRRLPAPWGRVTVATVTILLVTYTARFNIGHGMFGPLKDDERRYADVGVYLRALPPNAVVFSVQQSGSVRYYSGRVTIRWDLIDRDWTKRAAGEVERLGLHPYMVIEDWELPQMRGWFGLVPDAPIPWPLVARMRDHGGVSVLDLSTTPPGAIVPAALESGEAPHCSAQQPLTVQRP